MAIFVSYARKDRAVVETLRHDLERARLTVWLDDELTGGQAWWDTILGQIRSCQLFVFALSPDSLRSKACQAELQYALSLARPLLAVMVKPVSVQLTPAPIANSQIVDYTERTADSAVALVTAASIQRPPQPLPAVLPAPPPPPLSYLNPYREQIQSRDLSYRDQMQLVLSLRGHLLDEDERETASGLLVELRRRPDIAESVGRDIDELLAGISKTASARGAVAPVTPVTPPRDPGPLAPPSDPGPLVPPSIPATPTPTTVGGPTGATGAAGGWYADPYRRFEHRYWDGTTWTHHVSTAGQASTDRPPRQPATPLAAVSPTPIVAAAPGPFSGGAFVALLVATFFIPLVGIIVGAVNLKHPARRGQAQGLLWWGVAAFVLGVLLLTSGGG